MGGEGDRKWLLCAGRWIAAADCVNFDLNPECTRSGTKNEPHKLLYLR